ncbi:MAG: thiolase family protein [Acidimicrobiales bacterium]|nr:thiolase family protein [Acidimicrobiales bacterium]
MTEAVIVSTARTPIATSFKGSLVNTDAFELARRTLGEILDRSGVDPDRVDDVLLGETLYGGGDVARFAAVESGLVNAPGMAMNRHCASGLSAIQIAAGSIKSDMDRLVIAGGVHSQSTAPSSVKRNLETGENDRWMSPSHPETPDAPAFDMSITVAHNAAVAANVTREEMDAWAYRSHMRAVAAIDSGAFKEEIFAIDVPDGEGGTRSFAVDEHPRRDTTMERLASLKVLHPEIEGFSVTAGNAGGINDAAGAVLVAADDLASELGLEPLAFVKGWASVGVPPKETGLAPTKAIPKALQRVGLTVDDVDLFEINEAFAAMCVSTSRILGLDEEKVNVLGSGCSLGHPIAMTGSRMVMSLVHELRRRGGGTGVAAMCAGGGMAGAVVLEVPAP